LAKEDAMWDEFRTAKSIQQDAGELFVRLTDPFCPALAQVFSALEAPVKFCCSQYGKFRMTNTPERARPVLIDISPAPHDHNLKLQDKFTFGKWQAIDMKNEMRDVCVDQAGLGM